MIKNFKAFCNTKSHVQRYECQVIKNNVAFDGCLWQEINYLHQLGIKTIGSCCGHHINSINNGYIQVDPKDENKMADLKYIAFINEQGIKCFYPKTIIIPKQ